MSKYAEELLNIAATDHTRLRDALRACIPILEECRRLDDAKRDRKVFWKLRGNEVLEMAKRAV